MQIHMDPMENPIEGEIRFIDERYCALFFLIKRRGGAHHLMYHDRILFPLPNPRLTDPSNPQNWIYDYASPPENRPLTPTHDIAEIEPIQIDEQYMQHNFQEGGDGGEENIDGDGQEEEGRGQRHGGRGRRAGRQRRNDANPHFAEQITARLDRMDTRMGNFETSQKMTNDMLASYFRSMGFNPNAGTSDQGGNM
jgi:hypothetical protein